MIIIRRGVHHEGARITRMSLADRSRSATRSIFCSGELAALTAGTDSAMPVTASRLPSLMWSSARNTSGSA